MVSGKPLLGGAGTPRGLPPWDSSLSLGSLSAQRGGGGGCIRLPSRARSLQAATVPRPLGPQVPQTYLVLLSVSPFFPAPQLWATALPEGPPSLAQHGAQAPPW